ncbi:MAG: type II CRISPR RNA-guided endonuclease Cas9 [Roseivirga sp.]|nr:type II CRISPR RNA-guided endonuclease Cas9 [Roseivirga sp.]
MKKVLGLDLGSASVGWAYVREAENASESSEILQLGSRVIQFDNFSKVDKSGKVSESKSPVDDFLSGKGLSPNAGRTQARGMRRNLQRFKLRRENLIQLLKDDLLFIDGDTPLTETGSESTHETLGLRAKAASEKIGRAELARVLLSINKKRGYKSSRKAKNEEDGSLIDGMAVAKALYEKELTPGQFVFDLLKSEKKYIPDFYRSDLKAEFDEVWNFQKSFYPEILNEEFYKKLEGQGLKRTAELFKKEYDIYTAKNTGRDRRLQHYTWRASAVLEQLPIEEAAYVLSEINNNLNRSSGYLGAISDRSKELFFNNKTIGQYLYDQIKDNPHSRLKNQVFYRQDYLDEFEKIWETQARFYPEMTSKIKYEVRDVVIFYQRRLKSQKHLVSFCEFEKNHKVCPKSSPLFQQTRIWQVLNNVKLTNADTKEEVRLADMEEWCEELFHELNMKGRLSMKEALKLIGEDPRKWESNFKELEGNRTNEALFKAYAQIAEREGLEIDLDESASMVFDSIKDGLEKLGVDIRILEFDTNIEGNDFDKQPHYQLWHLLYAAEDEGKVTNDFDGIYGQHDIKLRHTLHTKFGFKPEHTAFISNVSFEPDYGNLSSRALRKILPYLESGHNLAEAAEWAKYNHSSSYTKEEWNQRPLNQKLEILAKNSLRNPVVEKILNQMVNVVNAVIDDPHLGKPDEVRVELARELKKSAKERDSMAKSINDAKAMHEKHRKTLQERFGIKNPTRNDIVRYKLYLELEPLGYKTLYTNTYIDESKLFSKEVDVEHIIPKAKLFDDSFSNKTLSIRAVNLKKGDSTAFDFVHTEYGQEPLNEFKSRAELLFKQGYIRKGKYKKLLIAEADIPDDFIQRDLRNTQYIAKKAKEMLEGVIRDVTTTTGRITDKLREDWGLINVMKEINLPKYQAQGLTQQIVLKDGRFKEQIIDWSKRNDHRHHAMDALVVAFTKVDHVQYLNNLNASEESDSKLFGLKNKLTFKDPQDGKRKFKPPLVGLRGEAKKHLEAVLVSHKAKNKVVTRNKNKIRKKGKGNFNEQIQLTPRGQLHKETVYGRIQEYKQVMVKVSSAFNEDTIRKVTKPTYREALLKRLKEFGGDPKKAFTGKNSLVKKPIYLVDEGTIQLPEKVKLQWLEENYTVRKPVGPDLKIDKVIDQGARRVLQARLDLFNGNAKEAFADLEKSPIWLNHERGIAIKSVTISGVKNAEALHTKKDHMGNVLLNEQGSEIPSDYVSTGSNHHLALYKDEKGNVQDEVISFYEAVARANLGFPVVDKNLNADKGWTFLFSMKQNEYFIFPGEDFNPEDYDLSDLGIKPKISPFLFRMQKFSKLRYGNSFVRDYVFRHHLESQINDHKNLKDISYKNIKSLGHLEGMVKVRLNHLGNIVHIGE